MKAWGECYWVYCEVRDVEPCEGQQAFSGGPTPTGPLGPPLCSGPGCSSVPPVSCSPLHRHHVTTCFHQRLHPEPFCQVSNNATDEVNCLLFPEAREDVTVSVSTLASTDYVIESSFPLSATFSRVQIRSRQRILLVHWLVIRYNRCCAPRNLQAPVSL